MDLRKAVRVAWVLVVSQMRVGRAGANPRSFFGRPVALVLANSVAFSLLFLGSVAGGTVLQQADPGLPSTLLAEYLPFVPLGAVASVLLGGMMFELASTAKFATSDAVNWLPIRTREYVVGSSLALFALYLLALSVLAGLALGLGLLAHEAGLALLAVALGVVGLFEGALFIEIVRSVSQRTSTLGPKRGSAAIVVRAAVFLLVIFVFEVGFNPVLLAGAVRAVSGLGPLGYAIPLLWASDAVAAAARGDLLRAVVAVAADLGFVAAVAQVAVEARARFWVPVGGELRFEAHEYGSASRPLTVLGFTRGEGALLGKDLRGLVRRRELLPQLLVPFAVGVVLLVERGSGGAGDAVTFGVLAWTSGLAALLMAAQSFGQERRAVVHLYALPLRPRSVLKAKAAAASLVSLAGSAVLAAAAFVLLRPPLATIPGTIVAYPVAVVVGTLVGLVFGTRFSDFQDRPRPQFVRPMPMLGALGVYALVGAIAAGVPVLVAYGALPPTASVGLVAGAGIALAITLLGLAALADSGARRLLRQLPT